MGAGNGEAGDLPGRSPGTRPWCAIRRSIPDRTACASGSAAANRPEPAENLNGQIGYGVLRLRVGGS